LMESHDWRVRKRVSLRGKNLENLVLSVGIATVGFKDHRQWRQPVAMLIRKRCAQAYKKTKSRGIQRLAASHDRACDGPRSVFMEPSGAFDFSLQQRAVESVLKVARTEFGDGFDDFEAAQIRRMAHRRAPITADYRNVKQIWICAKQVDDPFAIVSPNGGVEGPRYRVSGDSLL